MAVTKHEDMGLVRLLQKARRLALTHPDADVKTTAAAAIQVVIDDLTTAGVTVGATVPDGSG
jgi:hypothetical protein